MEVREFMDSLDATDLLYLGDSVYAGHTIEGGVWLITWNGYPDDPRNRIYLEPEVLVLFDQWRRERR